MKKAELEIDGCSVKLGVVWAHFKPASPSTVSAFSLFVPVECFVEVFDERKTKPKETPWESHISKFLRDFGSMALNHYLRVLRRIESVEDEPFAWVLTSVDSVKLVAGGVLLEGKAEAFSPHFPILRPLR